MQAALIGLLVLAVVIVGTFLGVTALLLAPLVGIVAVVALLLWFARRRMQHKPPIE